MLPATLPATAISLPPASGMDRASGVAKRGGCSKVTLPQRFLVGGRVYALASSGQGFDSTIEKWHRSPAAKTHVSVCDSVAAGISSCRPSCGCGISALRDPISMSSPVGFWGMSSRFGGVGSLSTSVPVQRRHLLQGGGLHHRGIVQSTPCSGETHAEVTRTLFLWPTPESCCIVPST